MDKYDLYKSGIYFLEVSSVNIEIGKGFIIILF
jgi:hypothetical protein